MLGELTWLACRAVRKLTGREIPEPVAEAKWVRSGRVPWSPGYEAARAAFLRRSLADAALMSAFRDGSPLPAGYGFRFDERVVELPWIVSQLAGTAAGAVVLDAGSTLNRAEALEHPALRGRNVLIYGLAAEPRFGAAGTISYVYGDLRKMLLRDGCVDAAACISTLEHIGMDNTRQYAVGSQYAESDRDGWRPAVAELSRVLRPGGLALLTVPFGVARNHGWAQTFDAAGLEAISAALTENGGGTAERRFFRYRATGWEASDEAGCRDAEYFDIHAAGGRPAEDLAAAARAVACLRWVKPG
jgi:SAM-dependent methyltransferase